MGLHIMNYRAGMIGGTLEIRQDSPCGTIVTCRFPVKDGEE
jgi:nitrate/nitrite-specific signal transduction histidine kinase